MGDDERRASHRAETDVFVFVQRGVRRSLCQALDVSLVGARLQQIDPPLSAGQNIRLEFEPSNYKAFVVVGEVVRVNDDETVGVRFDGVSESIRNALRNVIADDQRFAPRTEVELDVTLIRGQDRLSARALDLSCGGMRIAGLGGFGYNPLDIAIVELQLELDGEVHTITLGAKALREHEDGSMSLEFVAVSQEKSALLDAYVGAQGWAIF